MPAVFSFTEIRGKGRWTQFASLAISQIETELVSFMSHQLKQELIKRSA